MYDMEENSSPLVGTRFSNRRFVSGTAQGGERHFTESSSAKEDKSLASYFPLRAFVTFALYVSRDPSRSGDAEGQRSK